MNTGCNLKTTKLLDCALIGICAVIRMNTVYLLHVDLYSESILQTISSRLKRSLPDNLSEALSDGVLLCHLANQIRPRSVASVHVPSPAVVSVNDTLPYDIIILTDAQLSLQTT